ncbi:MAG: carboxypeptidase-like regulatory domain-containing protein, partial [Bacteroidota bacterium]
MLNIFLFLLIASIQVFSQQFVLKGKVYDKNSFQQGLAYANIRIAGTLSGTSATNEGFYELRLAKGNYQLIVSNIGYTTDTVSVNLNNNETINIGLTPVPVNLPEVTV